MYKAADVLTRFAAMRDTGERKPDMIRALSGMCLGWLYVFGASRRYCTPDVRTYFAGLRPDHKKAIYDACPYLSGKIKSCAECAYQGTLVNDCQGFNKGLLAWVGIQLYGNTVTAQWETASNWAKQGPIEEMPKDLVCCVFRTGHTGTYMGNGKVRHCGGKKGCVQEEALPGSPKWQKYGIPAGLYTMEELREAGVYVAQEKNFPTIRKGASGDNVRWLQLMLNEEMGAGLNVDGVFGEKTEEAVKAFQKAHPFLTVDGIVGPKTWAALEACEDKPAKAEEQPEKEPYDPPEDEQPEEEAPETPDAEPEKPVVMSWYDFKTIRACIDTLEIMMRKYQGGT